MAAASDPALSARPYAVAHCWPPSPRHETVLVSDLGFVLQQLGGEHDLVAKGGSRGAKGGGDGHKLNRRVRPVHDDHLPRWQGRQARGSWTEGVRTRRQTPTASPVDAVRCADLEARDVAAWMQPKGLLILCG
jgi:hypothetical protein